MSVRCLALEVDRRVAHLPHHRRQTFDEAVEGRRQPADLVIAAYGKANRDVAILLAQGFERPAGRYQPLREHASEPSCGDDGGREHRQADADALEHGVPDR